MCGVTFFTKPDDMVNQLQIQAITMHFMVSQALLADRATPKLKIKYPVRAALI